MHINLLNRSLIKWVLYTSLGWGLSQAAGIFIANLAFPKAELTALPTSPLYFAVFGFFFGLSQWICIRDHIPNSFRWVIATATGCFAAALILKVLNRSEMINSFLRGLPLLVYFFGGLIIGFAQHQTMKKTLPKAHWWIIVVTVSWVITQIFIGIDNAVVDFLGVLFFTTVTGLTFIWLVQKPSPEMQAA
jgi:hypothetical protein